MLLLNWPMVGLWFWLLTLAELPDGALAVKVGDTLPHFAAQTSAGASWNTDALVNQRVLVRFFRGHW